MVIVDAQVHLWGADTPQRPWLPDGAANAHPPVPLGMDELLRDVDAAGVDRVVTVPPSWEGDRNDLALEAARLPPDRFAIMGRLPIEKPESRGLVDGWRRQPGMLGVRLTFHRGPCPAIQPGDTRSGTFTGISVVWSMPTDRAACSGARTSRDSDAPYRQAVTLFTDELDFLSSDDKEWIMGRGIAEWLGWPLPHN
ncbi:MAG: hypothetical protein M3361_12095 [Candidatus Tectomicrobia bacterium]|nr:hypothetical protein [Candidatus Tectomicrobia bacterium]